MPYEPSFMAYSGSIVFANMGGGGLSKLTQEPYLKSLGFREPTVRPPETMGVPWGKAEAGHVIKTCVLRGALSGMQDNQDLQIPFRGT